MGPSIPTQPVLPWAPFQILLKIAPNVPLWEQWKIPKFQTKIRSSLDFMAFKTVRVTTHFCPHVFILKDVWKPINSFLYKI